MPSSSLSSISHLFHHRTQKRPRICLFWDVVVPAVQKAPVLAWINGGGYAGGWKPLYGNPAGLLAKSMDNCQQGVVYVAMNYRTGHYVSPAETLAILPRDSHVWTDNFEISNRRFHLVPLFGRMGRILRSLKASQRGLQSVLSLLGQDLSCTKSLPTAV
jgi:hypothetical protein